MPGYQNNGIGQPERRRIENIKDVKITTEEKTWMCRSPLPWRLLKEEL